MLVVVNLFKFFSISVISCVNLHIILSIEFKYRRHKAHPKFICVILLMDQSLENEGILSSLSSFTN